MQRLGTSGTWELFVPGATIGQRYKFVVVGAEGEERDQPDPFAFDGEAEPHTASIIRGLGGYSWNDHDWRDRRAANSGPAPSLVTKVDLAAFQRAAGEQSASPHGLARAVIGHFAPLGTTHIEVVTGAASRGHGRFAQPGPFRTPDDFRRFIDALHAGGIGVVMTVSLMVDQADENLAQFDGPRVFEATCVSTGPTTPFDLAKPAVRAFLLSNVMWWLHEFHVDGIDLDAQEFPATPELEPLVEQLRTAVAREAPGAFVMGQPVLRGAGDAVTVAS
jgi:1,4-alpha-glucan branching enzyme